MGLNCALGAEQLRPYVQTLSKVVETYVTAHPNAGLPNELGGYDQTPEYMAELVGEFAQSGLVNLIGGCCGTSPEHIKAIADAVAPCAPRPRPEVAARTRLSGLEPLNLDAHSLFVNVEADECHRISCFCRLIKSDDYETALDVARQQVSGAQVIDVNMDEGLTDSEAAMVRFLRLVAAEPDISRVPVMIDSSKWSVIEAGLKCIQGKGIVNSISSRKASRPLLNRQRSAGGMVQLWWLWPSMKKAADTPSGGKKSAVAYRVLVEEVNFPPEDIIFDPNIFAIGTGIESTRRTGSTSLRRHVDQREPARRTREWWRQQYFIFVPWQ